MLQQQLANQKLTLHTKLVTSDISQSTSNNVMLKAVQEFQSINQANLLCANCEP